ncbi:MAG: hypothetical protein ACYDGO_00495 [Smithellaceae bacterium]
MALDSIADAGGMFGPPQTVSKESGGLNTAIGYWYHEDTFKSETDHQIRQHQVYSQVSYGSKNIWEIYGRIGMSDLKIFDAFRSTHVLTATSKDHFEENWKFVGSVGAKGFFPLNRIFGIGAFLQASYNFSNFTDDIVGIHNATPFIDDLKIKNLWDVNFGIGLQAAVPFGIKLYAGPYIYYAEADAYLSYAIPGLQSGSQKVSWKNKSIAGGFFGVDIPLAKGFRLNIEGQYTDRFSVGSAITYTY